MKVISEAEKQQILAATWPSPGADRERPPPAPMLSFEDYLRWAEQLARVLPQRPRPFAQGEHWKL